MEETTARGFAELREALASRTGTRPEDWFPVFKARYGMQVAFDAVRSVRGDGSVLTQLFTCCTAVDPIVVSGLRPRYADVGADTMGIDVAKVESMPLGSDEQVHAMVMQHTFGAIDEDSSRRLAALAGEMGALLVEDCAHCVTRMARDAAGWPLADISVHSFGVEKMLPTRFGGAIWVNPRLRGMRRWTPRPEAGSPRWSSRPIIWIRSRNCISTRTACCRVWADSAGGCVSDSPLRAGMSRRFPTRSVAAHWNMSR